jgi:hypothetical protein
VYTYVSVLLGARFVFAFGQRRQQLLGCVDVVIGHSALMEYIGTQGPIWPAHLRILVLY